MSLPSLPLSLSHFLSLYPPSSISSHLIFLSPPPFLLNNPIPRCPPHLHPTSTISIHLQPWRTTVSRWCSSRHGWCASRWPTSVCQMRVATSASSTLMPRTTRWRRCLFRCPPRRPRWRWNRMPWREARWSSPVSRHAASRPQPCVGCAVAGRYQVCGHAW